MNQQPVADAGPDQVVHTYNTQYGQRNTVTLDGTASADPDTDPLTYSWTQLSGPSVQLGGSGTVAQPTFTAPLVSGYLTFQLIVNDGTQDSLPDTVQITVQQPVVLLWTGSNLVDASLQTWNGSQLV